MIYFAQKTALHHYKQVSLWSGWIWSMLFSHPQKWSEFWHFEKLWILALVCTHMEIFGFEVNHEYIIQYVEAVEHNSWTFEVHFDTFSACQTVWGILYKYNKMYVLTSVIKQIMSSVPVQFKTHRIGSLLKVNCKKKFKAVVQIMADRNRKRLIEI